MNGKSRVMPPEAIAALAEGRRVTAIHEVVEANDISLKEAKDLVEAYLAGQWRQEAAAPAAADGAQSKQNVQHTPPVMPESALTALAHGNVAEAIQVMQDVHRLDWDSAKALIDAYQYNRLPGLKMNLDIGDGLALPIMAVVALARGHKIEAIKAVRDVHGLDLRDAREWVEAYRKGRKRTATPAPKPPRDAAQQAAREAARPAAAKTVSRDTGGKGVTLVALAVVAFVLLYFLYKALS